MEDLFTQEEVIQDLSDAQDFFEYLDSVEEMDNILEEIYGDEEAFTN